MRSLLLIIKQNLVCYIKKEIEKRLYNYIMSPASRPKTWCNRSLHVLGPGYIWKITDPNIGERRVLVPRRDALHFVD